MKTSRIGGRRPKTGARFRAGGWLLIGFGLLATSGAAGDAAPLRRTLSLDGVWSVSESVAAEPVPTEWTHTAPVPGLLDEAEPPFSEVGQPSARRRWFWYRRVFRLDTDPPAAVRLKLHKARYGTKVWLNGRVVGEHLPCFTPAEFDPRPFLRAPGAPNELIVRVGADRSVLPPGQPGGWDFEKYRYFPGIYDSVELILSGEPRIVNVQTVPDLPAQRVRVLVELATDTREAPAEVQVVAREVASGAEVTRATARGAPLRPGQPRVLDLILPLPDCHLWSPEDPFRYELTLTTPGDETRVRFGMRSFRFDPRSGRAVLNERTYFLRGSNVTIYRFFEDAARGHLPWNRDWVRRLHRKFKEMHWNTLRYCIGFPPDFWYDIADEEGMLIQDEFPIWVLSKAPERPVAERIIPEYTEWMRARWNHPSVVIWDAQNESATPETGLAIQAVRHLDYSNRPWENGWSAPQGWGDCVEAHPYLFIREWAKRKPFHLSDLARESGRPHLRTDQRALPVPILINEYGWLWLTRDGQPTSLTGKIYDRLLGPDATADQRRELYARYLAALTEFWRAHRECAGVLHFCGLGYSRPGDRPRPEGGATSDHWLSVEQLTFEPRFRNYVGDAFNPLGLMLDFWDERVPAGGVRPMTVVVINDRYTPWLGEVRLRLQKDGRTVWHAAQPGVLAPLGRQQFPFTVAFPDSTGPAELIAELTDVNGRAIQSHRAFTLTKP